jgi:hypothetical protein
MATTSSATVQFITALKTLTPLEILALRSALVEFNGDFGFTDDIVIPNLSKRATGGVISSLLKKDIITRDDEFGQFCFGPWHGDLHDEAPELVEAFFKGLDAPCPTPPATDKAEARKARRKARRAARKAAKAAAPTPDDEDYVPVPDSKPEPAGTMFVVSKPSGVHAGSCVLGAAKTEESALIDAFGPKPWTAYQKKSARTACVREVTMEEYTLIFRNKLS